MIDLIYTSGNNKTYAEMSQEAGWLIGMRSDKTPCDVPISFVDINYKEPNWPRHLVICKRLHPRYAIIPDLNELRVSKADIDRTLYQYEQISSYCEVPLIVPKVVSQLALLPSHMAIGLSIVSRYGGVQSVEFEFLPLLEGRRVHLLGGSPHKQMEMYRYISCYADVVSADGNMFQRMSGYGKYWQSGKWIRHPRFGQKDPRVSSDCIMWSLKNIRCAWENI